VVVIPLTAWLGRLFGMRLSLQLAIIQFTAFSLVCATSTSLTQMIIGRVGQGFAGGSLIPAGLTIIATRLTPDQRPIGLSIYATTTVLAPVLGPLIGGWLTENLSWHWIFYMNLPLGGLMLGMIVWGMDPEPMRRDELAKADWLGIAGLVLALAGLVVVLEEGQRKNWFDSTEIVTLTLLSLTGFAMILWSQFRAAHPVLKFRLMRDPRYCAAIVCISTIGGAPYAVVYLISTFLGTIAGYNAQQTGVVSFYAGITSFLCMPLLAYILSRIDIRLMIGGGMVLFACATYSDTGLTAESVGASFLLSQLVRGGAQMLGTLPLSQVATAGMPPEDAADGVALFTVFRNLGGSAALAMCGVMLDRRFHFHAEQLGSATTANSPLAQERIADLAAGLMQQGADAGYAQMQAARLIAGEVQRQALVMAYADCFWLASMMILIALPAVFFVRRSLGDGRAVAH